MRQTFSGKVKRGETEVQELPVERRVLPGKYKAIYLGDNCTQNCHLGSLKILSVLWSKILFYSDTSVEL